MKKILPLWLLIFLGGCVSTPPVVYPREYREIPGGLLQPCVLPEMPITTGELSEAFVAAYKCGELGNKDKQRIRELTNPSPE